MDSKVEITNLIQPIISLYGGMEAEFSNLLESGLHEYLIHQTNKYYLVNTFIHRGYKVKFFDIYFPLKAKHKLLKTDFIKIHDVFEEYNMIMIIGGAGSGKSTLVKSIFLNSLKAKFKIPVLIELRHLNDDENEFHTYILDVIIQKNIKPSNPIAKRYLNKGGFIFLLDGFDEVYSSKKNRIAHNIEDFIDKYPENKYVVTSRPDVSLNSFIRLKKFYMQDLDDSDIISFVELIEPNKERKRRLLRLIQSEIAENYIEYLRNPLLLSMFILAYEKHPEIPKQVSSFYENVFDTLYSQHDGITKGSFPRERKTGMLKEEFKELISIFSYLTFMKQEFSFTKELFEKRITEIKSKSSKFRFDNEDLIFDLHTSISLFLKEGFEYKFPHRSLQEFFAASFVLSLKDAQKRKAFQAVNDLGGGSENKISIELFLRLSYEMDPISTKEFFIIPVLKPLIRKLEESLTPEAILAKYLYDFDVSIKLWQGNLKSSKVIRSRINLSVLKFTSIGIFNPVNSLDKISLSLLETLIAEKMSKKNKNDISNLSLTHIVKNYPTIKAFFLKDTVIRGLASFYSQTVSVVKELEKDVEDNDFRIDEYIDFK